MKRFPIKGESSMVPINSYKTGKEVVPGHPNTKERGNPIHINTFRKTDYFKLVFTERSEDPTTTFSVTRQYIRARQREEKRSPRFTETGIDTDRQSLHETIYFLY